VAGSPYQYDVDAIGRPAPSFVLDAAPSGMTLDSASGVIEWTPTSTGSFAVTVRTQNGVLPDAVQTWTITVAGDQAPRCRFTRPADGAVVAGRTEEWFGDGFDDVRTTKMEFFVDDQLVYTDQAVDGHYHFGGEHSTWDTTVLGNGSHRLRGVVTDTAGQSGTCEVTVEVANQASPLVPPKAKSCGCSSDGTPTAAPLLWVLAAALGLRRRGSRD
jgi:MYXO-CTERM domain-containing protein